MIAAISSGPGNPPLAGRPAGWRPAAGGPAGRNPLASVFSTALIP